MIRRNREFMGRKKEISRIKKKIAILTVSVVSVTILLAGCGSAEKEEKETEDTEIRVNATGNETSSLGIDSNAKSFEEKLTDNTYYVVHEGVYYPVYTYYKNEAAQNETATSVNEDRMIFYTMDNFTDIPTLFPGDHLVFYSTDTMLDHITWERYRPLGVTFGMYNLQRTTGGKYYLDIAADEEIILPDSALYELYNLPVDNVTIDKIGGVVVDDDVVMDGIVVGATEGTDYDVEVYTGTYYKHYNVKADTYAFKAYELFASTGMQTLQDRFWEIDIPEYFVDGYYEIDGLGMVRIVRENDYSDETDFAEQIIFPDPNSYEEGKFEAVTLYSEVEELNKFTQETYPDRVGYTDPDAEETQEEEDTLPEAAKFKEANVKEYELWFPEDKECTIEIRSKSGESTGSASITYSDGKITNIDYNRFDEVYLAVVNGTGETGTLTISGFWYDYDITLTNAEIYEGQDMARKPADAGENTEDASEKEKTETEDAGEEK